MCNSPLVEKASRTPRKTNTTRIRYISCKFGLCRGRRGYRQHIIPEHLMKQRNGRALSTSSVLSKPDRPPLQSRRRKLSLLFQEPSRFTQTYYLVLPLFRKARHL